MQMEPSSVGNADDIALSEIQIQILQGLDGKGPGLLVDVAVRARSFTDEIAGPLRQCERALPRGAAEADRLWTAPCRALHPV